MNEEGAVGAKRAVLYLRVSSQSQVGTDYDPEGLSIPAQRKVCESRAEQLGIEVAGEYVELGRSGLTAANRPKFQEMLARVRADRDIEYVIVYKLSRLNRNRLDDAMVIVELRSLNVSLISATENIDETPEGQLMHGVLASFNEFRSRSDGQDIKLKMLRKAEQGGTIGRAPLGYLNVREALDDRTVSSVAIDPVRGPLVLKAFELYSAGDYTIERLQDRMVDLGLKPRPSRRWPDATEVSAAKLHRMLSDTYYAGMITYGDEQYVGRHQALVPPELFERVQEILQIRSQNGSRDRVHFHYLKGLLFCQRCHSRGQRTRMVYTEAQGRGGVYAYFMCLRRNDRTCDLPYLPVPLVENAVVEHFSSIELPRAFADGLDEAIAGAVRDSQRTVADIDDALRRRLAELDVREERILDLAEEGGIPAAKLRERMRKVQRERDRLTLEKTETDARLAVGAEVLATAMRNLAAVYRHAPDEARGFIAHALFEALYLEEEVGGSDLKEPFRSLSVASRTQQGLAANAKRPDLAVEALGPSGSLEPGEVNSRGGSSTPLMAEDGVSGFRTS